jgi:hypothetical protein
MIRVSLEDIDADNNFMLNYYVEHPVYPERSFCHRFYMSLDLFNHIT